MDISPIRHIQQNTGVHGVTVTVPGVKTQKEAKAFYSIIHKSIVDGHISIVKPIAFRMEANTKKGAQAIDNKFVLASQTLESLPEIATKVESLLIKGWALDDYTDMNKLYLRNTETERDNNAELSKGPIITGEHLHLQPMTLQDKGVRFVESNVKICTAVNDTLTIYLIVNKNAGYTTMEDNATALKHHKNEAGYFYMNTNFTLIDYVRVLPYEETNLSGSNLTLPIKLYKGFTADLFIKYLIEMIEDFAIKVPYTNWLTREGGELDATNI